MTGEEHRQARRRIVSLAARVGSQGQAAQDVEVVDLPERGFRLNSDAPAAQGSALFIKLLGTEARRARVIWCGNARSVARSRNISIPP